MGVMSTSFSSKEKKISFKKPSFNVSTIEVPFHLWVPPNQITIHLVVPNNQVSLFLPFPDS